MKTLLKALCITLSLLLLSSGAAVSAQQPEAEPVFLAELIFETDIHIAYCNGYPDGSIRPQAPVTRAEACAIFYRILRDDIRGSVSGQSEPFSDVAPGDWCYSAVATMYQLQFISGASAFRPNETITRAELAVMAVNVALSTGAPDYADKNFSDIKGHWAERQIRIAATLGWLNGYGDGAFLPDQTITRAELISAVNRMSQRQPESADDLLPGMKTFFDNRDVSAWYYLDIQEASNSHRWQAKNTLVPGQHFYYERWVSLEEDCFDIC